MTSPCIPQPSAPLVAALAGTLLGWSVLPGVAAESPAAAEATTGGTAVERPAAEDRLAEAPPPAAGTPEQPPTAENPRQERPWAGTLELYGFAPLRVTNTATVRGFSATTDVGLGAVLQHLTDVFYLRGSVEYKRLGLLTDLSYVGLGAQQSRRFSPARGLLADGPGFPGILKADLATTQGIYDIALRYRLGKRERAVGRAGDLTVIPYAGIRILDVGVAIDASYGFGPFEFVSVNRSAGTPLVQPLVGMQGQVFLAPRLRLFARGDVGGFSPSGNPGLSGNAQLGLGYAIGNSTQLDLSWRYLYLARNKDTATGTGYAIDQNGIEAGIKFFF
ncbi:MAG: hypothetical protein ER33_15035 [Cyanobium sp. CACIAM 14]|nr:MAG: hypothetical protein ER33_15035 [Cyanobium sp. CACIAM 14]